MSDDESRGFAEGTSGQIAWRRFGSGPPLVLINGYAATKDDWDPTFLETLGERSTVYCPDNRGIGESGGPAEGISIAGMAEDVVALMDELSLATADLAAWSMGGFIAQTVAASVPARVGKLVLLSTDPGGGEAVPRTDEVHARLTDHDGSGSERARRLLGLLFPPEFAEAVFTQFGEIVAAAQEQLPLDVVAAQEAAMEAWYGSPAAERLASIEAPAMVATGSLDVVIPPANAELLAATLPDSWLAHFAGGGHAFMAQEPLRLGAAINAFLDR